MNRIDSKFKELKSNGKKAMIPFITAGDPSLDMTPKLVYELECGGADIIEIGIPYSDPLADGPVIQNSSSRALLAGVKIHDIMNMVAEIRNKSNIPLIYLVYYSCIFKYGVSKFLKDCSMAGVDGLIIPDLPIEEREDINNMAENLDIDLIPLVAPTSNERIKKIVNNGRGFVYCVSVRGVTGIRSNINTNIKEYMRNISEYTKLPLCLGFGISGPEAAKKYKDYCDGVIVGSAIVDYISKGKNPDDMKAHAKDLVKSISDAINI